MDIIKHGCVIYSVGGEMKKPIYKDKVLWKRKLGPGRIGNSFKHLKKSFPAFHFYNDTKQDVTVIVVGKEKGCCSPKGGKE